MKKVLDIILPGVIAGIFSFAGIYFATVYTQSKSFQNKRQEALLEIDKNNYDKKQMFYRKYLEFTTTCLNITSIHISKDINDVQLPSIAMDTALNKLWNDQKTELIKLKDSIDYRVYYAFEAILSTYKNNPFPDLYNKEDLLSSEWCRNKLYERWISDAGYLKYLINKKLNLEIDESYY